MSNDTADCGCEGHCENFTECKYPAAIKRIKKLEQTLKSILRETKDKLEDHLAENGGVVSSRDGTGQHLEFEVEWIDGVLKGKN